MYDIVGYTHSDGYALCTDHAIDRRTKEGIKRDSGNESGYVQPIFEDSEWDSYPSCDVCHCEIETSLTTDGIEWLHSTGRKLWYESDSEDIEETEEEISQQ